jgi:hypothetical protein
VAGVRGAAAAVTPYIGATAAVPHNGINLPPWPTVVGCRGPRSPLRTVGGPLAAVVHGSFLANRRGARRLVAKSEKNSNGFIILQNDLRKI